MHLYAERRGSGEPLLLIMGMAGHHRIWGEPFLAGLAERFEVLTFDQRGIGTSDRADGQFSTAELADDAARVMDEAGWTDAHVFGISLGGMVAQELVLNHRARVRRLTLGCTSPGVGSGERRGDSARGAAGIGPGPERLLAAMRSGREATVLRTGFEVNLSAGFAADPAHFAAYQEDALAARVPVPVVGMQFQAALQHNAVDRLPALDVPALVIHGTADQMILPTEGERLAMLIPGARLELLEGAGHLFWREQPERVIELLSN
ncbi:alpha/beta fold hydrolase [Kribbella italica]|uniref:Pimeloyl-ACP methyl ester carboxylesterase n=1 Tax=Kribbella italica TaxID=1540520 RepID=A0A7W9J1F1_9ACTN|nr:alpha/beta fold hydrolase [Kribbella italica]MBB5833871.1 pimeloyl-ACP methyl ester carboxylesterase [Kribbella italica]